MASNRFYIHLNLQMGFVMDKKAIVIGILELIINIRFGNIHLVFDCLIEVQKKY
jgi:hypothetical protein